MLAFVPAPLVGGEIPIPRAHLSGGERQAPALLALGEPAIRSFQFRGALGDVPLEPRVQLLELARLAEQFGKHAHFGAQHFRHDRHRHVIDRAHLVAAQPVDVGQMDGRDENDRGLAEARMLADHRRKLKAVEIRHADVDQHDGDVVLEQELQRFPRRRRLDQILVEFAEDDVVSKQLVRLVVDQQHVDFLAHGLFVQRFLLPGCLVHRGGLAMQPHPQRGQELFGIDRLGEIIRRAGLQAFLAIALHRLGGQGDDRQAAKRPVSGGFSRWSDSRPFPAS